MLKQITEWGHLRPGADIRLASSSLPATLRALASEVLAAVIDATEHPEAAMRTLGGVLAVLRTAEMKPKLGVYTEKVYEGLEMFVRLRGILFLLGPMGPVEWDGFFGTQPIDSPVGDEFESGFSDNQNNQPGGRRVLSTLDGTNRARTHD